MFKRFILCEANVAVMLGIYSPSCSQWSGNIHQRKGPSDLLSRATRVMNLDVLRFVLQMTRGNPVPSPSVQSPRVWVGAPGLPYSQPLKETAFFMPAGRDFPSALTATPSLQIVVRCKQFYSMV